MLFILVTDDKFSVIVCVPVNVQIGVVVHKSALIRAVIVACALVHKLSAVAQYQKAVGKSFEHIELTFVLGRKHKALPLAVGLAVFS